MANEIQTAPSTTLADNDDWEQELNLRELAMKGYDGISLTEWAAGDTDRPEIAAGSVIEIDGAIAKFTNQTAIADEGGIADGWCYIKFVVSGSDVTPTLTNTFGTWDTAKQGFYDGNDRYSLHVMYRSGAVTKIYTRKSNMTNRDGLPVISQYDTDQPYVIGRVSLDSSLSAGEIIKLKRYTFTITNGSNSYTLTHGIANAATNNRIISVRMKNNEPGGIPTLYGGESGGTYRFLAYYSFRNSDVILYLGATQNADRVYTLDVIYI